MNREYFKAGDKIEWFQGPRKLRRTGVVTRGGGVTPIECRRDSNGSLCYVLATAHPRHISERIEKCGADK